MEFKLNKSKGSEGQCKDGLGFNLCEVEGLLECEHSRRVLDMAL